MINATNYRFVVIATHNPIVGVGSGKLRADGCWYSNKTAYVGTYQCPNAKQAIHKAVQEFGLYTYHPSDLEAIPVEQAIGDHILGYPNPIADVYQPTEPTSVRYAKLG